jgi:hypothetical protein
MQEAGNFSSTQTRQSPYQQLQIVILHIRKDKKMTTGAFEQKVSDFIDLSSIPVSIEGLEVNVSSLSIDLTDTINK